MTGHFKAVFLVGLAICFVQVPIVAAQQTKTVPAAPLPAQILSAKKVFVANAGGEEWAYSDAAFNGGPDRAYNQFYAALKSWGRYDLVSAPADADLLFEIQFNVPSVEHQLNMENYGALAEPFDPQFRLVIRDAKTSALLWAMTEHAQWAILGANREKNFDRTLEKLVGYVKVLAGHR
jgi:hypothetical protein